MDWEAPVDGWYVWLAVALASLAFVGIALSLPSAPPPDATRTANTIDDVAGTNYEASARMEHDAEAVKIDGRRIEMRNDDGNSHASLAFGEVVIVNGHDKLENVAYGSSFADEYEEYPGESTDEDSDSKSSIWGDDLLTCIHVVDYLDTCDETDDGNASSADSAIRRDLADAWGNRSEWKEANGELVVRTVSWDPDIRDLEGHWEAKDHQPDYLQPEEDRYYVTLVVV